MEPQHRSRSTPTFLKPPSYTRLSRGESSLHRERAEALDILAPPCHGLWLSDGPKFDQSEDHLLALQLSSQSQWRYDADRLQSRTDGNVLSSFLQKSKSEAICSKIISIRKDISSMMGRVMSNFRGRKKLARNFFDKVESSLMW